MQELPIDIRLINYNELSKYLSLICENDQSLMNEINDYEKLIMYLQNSTNMKKFKSIVNNANRGIDVHKWVISNEFSAIQKMCEMFDLQRHWNDYEPINKKNKVKKKIIETETKNSVVYKNIPPEYFFSFLYLVYRIKDYVMSLR